MTLEEMRAAIEAKRANAEAREATAKTEFDGIMARAKGEGRSNLTPEEDARTDELLTEMRKAGEARKEHAAEVARLDGEIEAERAAEADAKTAAPSGVDAPKRGGAVVGREARTYSKERAERGEVNFLADVAGFQLGGDFAAQERLARHMQEEKVERGHQLRAVGTSAFGGLVLPQYLTDMYLPAATTGRPFADICNKHPLPGEGMTVELSRVTTSTSVDIQASQGDAVSETNMDDSTISVSVQTNAGQQTASFQAIQRGRGTEDVILQDLFKQYHKNLDSKLLNQATNGLTNVATSNAYTDASPTAAELYPKIIGAASAAEGTFLDMAEVDYAIMHSRRWYWLQKELTTSWPSFAQPNIDPKNLGKNNGVGYNKGVRGLLPNGLLVIVDNNVASNLGAGTNEDEIYVVASDECHLWEDPSAPIYIRAEQTKAANLQVLFVIYGYFAYTFNRFSGAHQKIAGTGLVTPTF